MKLKNLFCFLLTCFVFSGISASNVISNKDHRFLPYETGTWTNLGEGIWNGRVYDVIVWDSEVYVVGNFLDAGNVSNADRIAKWNGKDFQGNSVQNGSYFCLVKSGDYSKTLEFSVIR